MYVKGKWYVVNGQGMVTDGPFDAQADAQAKVAQGTDQVVKQATSDTGFEGVTAPVSDSTVTPPGRPDKPWVPAKEAGE